MSTIRMRSSWVVALLAVALAFGSVGCGDGGEKDDATGAARDTETSTQPTPTTTNNDGGDVATAPKDKAPDAPAKPQDKPSQTTNDDASKEQAAAVVAEMYKAFAAGDAPGVCATMSKAARKKIASQVPGGISGAEAASCAESFGKFLPAAARSGMLERVSNVRVLGVTVDGDKAAVTVAFGNASGELGLVREEGEWRLGEPPGSSPSTP